MDTPENSPNPELAEFYSRIDKQELAPLWEVIHRLVAPKPITRAVPHLWQYEQVRPFLMESGTIISAKEAERRVLILENPVLRGEARTADTLYAGLQLILPGEVAPAHRHTPAALRFILEGEGAYTAVDGERAYMSVGDFILTPSWSWHDHGHEGVGAMVWLDGLDIPQAHFFGATFGENYPEERYPATRPPETCNARYGANLRAVDDEPTDPASPLFSYPYSQTRPALEQLCASRKPNLWHGYKLEYRNPMDGGSVMPTISAFLHGLPQNFQSQRYQTTEHQIFSVVEGTGRTVVGEGENQTEIEWGPRDHFVIPGWYPYAHETEGEVVLFSFSDQVSQKKLGLWREQRHD
tara:strand:- start:2822 stop:3877 length:1056 start_codon:yes stop_codon:yes gene_type:complete